jgi:hypothetical protein
LSVQLFFSILANVAIYKFSLPFITVLKSAYFTAKYYCFATIKFSSNFILLVLFFCGIHFASAQSVPKILLQDATKEYVITHQLGLREEVIDISNEKETIQNKEFEVVGKDIVNLNKGTHIMCVKIPIENKSELTKWYLEIGNGLADIDLYVLQTKNGNTTTFKKTSLGFSLPFEERFIQTDVFLIPLELPKNQTMRENSHLLGGIFVPRSLGANPLLTISALSERICRIMARDKNWGEIPYSFKKYSTTKNQHLVNQKNRVLENPVSIPRNEIEIDKNAIGISFTETMKGYFSVGEKENYKKGYTKRAKKINLSLKQYLQFLRKM